MYNFHDAVLNNAYEVIQECFGFHWIISVLVLVCVCILKGGLQNHLQLNPHHIVMRYYAHCTARSHDKKKLENKRCLD